LIVSETGNGSWNDFISSIKHNFDDPLAILLAQIVMIILVARLLVGFQEDWTANGYEIIAGIVLGPRYWECIFLVFCRFVSVESLGI
jgi:hypothetical protein